MGFLINLPLVEKSQLVPKSCKNMVKFDEIKLCFFLFFKKKTLVKFKNHLYYEEKDNFSGEEKKLKPLKGSSVSKLNKLDE